MPCDNFKDLWNTILDEMALTVSNANFNTWFKNTAIVEKTDSMLAIGTNSNFTKEWLQKKYHNFIIKAVNHICPEISEIKYVVVSTNTIQNAQNIQVIQTSSTATMQNLKLKRATTFNTETLLKASPDPKLI